jgi:hypothetical protein
MVRAEDRKSPVVGRVLAARLGCCYSVDKSAWRLLARDVLSVPCFEKTLDVLMECPAGGQFQAVPNQG